MKVDSLRIAATADLIEKLPVAELLLQCDLPFDLNLSSVIRSASLTVLCLKAPNDRRVDELTSKCPSLRSLKLTCAPLLKMPTFSCVHLTSLVLFDCPVVTDDAISALTHSCRQLLHLEMVGCCSLSRPKLSLPALERLIITDCGVDDHFVSSLSVGCPLVMDLSISGCAHVYQPNISLPLLRMFEVPLNHDSTERPQLSLDAVKFLTSHCGSLHTLAVFALYPEEEWESRLSINSQSLRSLMLLNGQGLSPSQFYSLLCDCPYLSDLAIEICGTRLGSFDTAPTRSLEVRVLHVDFFDANMSLVQQILSSCPNVYQADIELIKPSSFEWEHVSAVQPQPPAWRKLTLKSWSSCINMSSCGSDDSEVVGALASSTTLEELCLQQSNATRLLFRCPNLRRLSLVDLPCLNGEALVQLLIAHPSLVELHLSKLPSVTSFPRVEGSICPSLKHLTVSNMTQLPSSELQSFILCCSHREQLSSCTIRPTDEAKVESNSPDMRTKLDSDV
eukprot:GILJ01013291.1.p1 GENE.GILJ01013291.1~~GILJ01013291.1.p1  ORF type:complete len:505 (-),score=38.19 GILJ01013291.1:80-1594(-)